MSPTGHALPIGMGGDVFSMFVLAVGCAMVIAGFVMLAVEIAERRRENRMQEVTRG